MAAPARRLARAPRRALTQAQILRLVRFPAIRRAISGGLARTTPISVDIPAGGRFIRFRLVDPRRFHPSLFATIPLGTRGTMGVIGTKLSDVKKKGALAAAVRRHGRLLGTESRKGFIYQLRTAGIIGPSTLQSVLVPRSRVEQIVARFSASPQLRKVLGNPILATLGVNPLDRTERAQLLRRSRFWKAAAGSAKSKSVRQYIRGHEAEARAVGRAKRISDLWGTERHHRPLRNAKRRRARRNGDQDPIIMSGPEQVAAYRMLALKSALKLEMLGMKRRGPSALSIIKREFGLKGSKQAIFEKFSRMCEDIVEHRAKPPGFNPLTRAEAGQELRFAREAFQVGADQQRRGKDPSAQFAYAQGIAGVVGRRGTRRAAQVAERVMKHLRYNPRRHCKNPRACANPRHRHHSVRRNSGQQVINVPFRDGQKISPAQMRRWLASLPAGEVKNNIVRRFEQGMKQYKRFHLGSEPTNFTYRAIPMGSAGKQITDVDVVVSEGKEWAATYQVPRHSRKYEGKGADGRYIHTHGEDKGAKLEVDIKRVANRRDLPERFHTADGKFVGVVPSRNVTITDWYRG